MKRLLVIALLVGCSAAQPILVGSGSTLVAAGDTFVNVAAVYTAQCKPEPVAKFGHFCAAFKGFSPRFQAEYPVAVHAWNVARDANDNAAAVGAEATVLKLVSELSAITSQALAAAGG